MTKRLFDMITDGPPSPEAQEELALFRQAAAKAANRAARMGVTPTGAAEDGSSDTTIRTSVVRSGAERVLRGNYVSIRHYTGTQASGAVFELKDPEQISGELASSLKGKKLPSRSRKGA